MGTIGGVDGIDTGGGERIALIRIDGVIVAGESGFSMFGGAVTGSDNVVAGLERATEDETVKGVLLRINSPGGSAAGSQEIYAAINRAREGEKIVVASMADVAASGGYYVAAPADKIYADAASITGSIGAIAIHQNMAGLLDKVGVETEIIKSGKLKDMGQPTAPLGDDAREVITALIDEVFSQFVDHVAAGRGMDREDVLALADGRIYTGGQAQENGLVDEIGGYHEALMEAGRLAGIKGKPQIKEYGVPSFLRMLLGAGASTRPRPVAVTGGLLYDDVAARLAAGGVAVPITGSWQSSEAQ
jgi:protease-4